MDIKRNLLFVGLAVVSYLMLLAWNEDYPQESESIAAPTGEIPTAISGQGTATGSEIPVSAETTDNNDLPTAPVASAVTADAVATAQTEASRLITVTTPKQIVTIDLLGGDIVGLSLPTFPVSIDSPNDPFPLLRQDSGMVYVAQSGMIGRNGPDAGSNGRPLYSTSGKAFTIDSEEQSVDLVYNTADNVQITKRFIFAPDDFLIRVQYLVNNNSNASWQANMFGQIKRDGSNDPSDTGSFSLRTFLGAAVNTADDPYVKMDFEDIEDGVDPIENTGGWIAFSQHYFVSSWIPDSNSQNTFTMRQNTQGEYLMTFVNSAVSVAPGENASVEAQFWAGPKDQYRLEEISPNLGLTIDYGRFYFIAAPIFWLLTQINDAIGNYGFSILVLTLVINTLLFPLSYKSYRSMARMRQLAPKVQELKDRCGDDKQKFMQAQMELWRKEKVNPFGGCLPMLLQMPVFLGIYWVLNESVELRQASFILWYNDLSKMDPYFLLPILMGAGMFIQQQLTPMQTADPAQAKMMKFMPVIFSVFFLWFPAGLVLYYTANTVIRILQQWIISRSTEKKHRQKPA